MAASLVDLADVDARRRVLDEAYAVLALHLAGHHGFCSGCLDAARLGPVPCPLARCAVSIVATHGVAMWDVPSGLARPG